MIQHICDKCGEAKGTSGRLYRIQEVVSVGDGPIMVFEDAGSKTSQLDLCEDCKNAIMRMANTPTPREAGW